MVDDCISHLMGDTLPDIKDEGGGHYFTIWAPRQTGKTWLMRRAVEKIQAERGDRFMVGSLSMQGVVLAEDDPEERFLESVPRLFLDGLHGPEHDRKSPEQGIPGACIEAIRALRCSLRH